MPLFITLIALAIAQSIDSKHAVDSIFIKMKATGCLGNNVHAFTLAVLCKFLRSEVSSYKCCLYMIFMYSFLHLQSPSKGLYEPTERANR